MYENKNVYIWKMCEIKKCINSKNVQKQKYINLKNVQNQEMYKFEKCTKSKNV